MNFRLSAFAPVLFAGVVGLLSACGPDEVPPPPPPPPPPTSAEADPGKSQLTASPSRGSLANGSDEVVVTVTVKHRTGALLSGQNVTLEATGTGNTLTQPIGQTDATGVARGTLRSSVAEVKTLTAKVKNDDADAKEIVLTQTATAEFEKLPPAALAFDVQPAATVAAGQSLGAIRVAIKDASGTIVPVNTGVTLVLENAASVELLGTTTVDAVNGVAQFNDVRVTQVGTYKLLATAGTLPSLISSEFEVVPAAPSHFIVSGVASPMLAGDGTGIQIAARDEFDNLATNFTGQVRFTSTDLQATLPGDTAFPDDGSGFLTLGSGLVFRTAGTQTVSVRWVDQMGVVGNAVISIGAAPPSKLVFSTQPQNVETNTPFTVAVELHDEFDNLTQATAPVVDLELVGPAQFKLVGVTTQTPADGEATFPDLVIETETGATTLQLRATATGLVEISSTAFTVADVTPPGPVTDFAAVTVGRNDITLAWTAPGDDGAIGDATAYALRYGTTPIDATNFDTTGTVVSLPAPRQSGSAEAANIGGLTHATEYHFALRSTDSAGNHSFALATETTVDDLCAGVVVDDGVDCTVDSCDAVTGVVTHEPSNALCADSDGFACTDALCTATGCQENADNTFCDDGSSCTTDTCVGAGGDANGCTNVAEVCPFASSCQASGCAAVPQTGAVLVTEFMAIPAPGEVEYIELHNPGATPINVRGWSFENAGGVQAGIRAIDDLDGALGNDVEIPAGGYLVGVANPVGTTPLPAFAQFVYGAPGTAFALEDSGDGVMLWTVTGEVADLVDMRTTFKTADPLAANDFPGRVGVSTQVDPAQLTAAGNDSGANWCLTFYSATTRSRVSDTKGAANGSCSAVVINEILYDPAGADPGLEFIELAGPGGAALTGLKLRGLDGASGAEQAPDFTFGASHPQRMPLKGLVVIADGTGGITQVPSADVVATLSIQNAGTSGDSLVLRTSSLVTVDLVGYGPNVGAAQAEGSAALGIASTSGTTGVSLSLARKPSSADTENNADDFSYDPTPTPGSQNDLVVPTIVSVSSDNGPLGGGTIVTVVTRDFSGHGAVQGVSPPDRFVTASFAGVAASGTCTWLSAEDGGRGNSTFRCTVAPGTTPGTGNLTLTNPPAIGGQSMVVDGWTYTVSNNETDTAGEADYCILQAPSSFTVAPGATTPLVFGRIYEAGVTDTGAQSTGIRAEIGYGPMSSDPGTSAAWRFFATAYNGKTGDFGNDEEYMASFTAPDIAAQYAFTARFSFDGVNWTYCDLDGAGSNGTLDFSTAQLGTMTVMP